MLNNLYIKPSDNISTYNVNFMCYAFKLGQKNSILCYCYYQELPNQIQDPISIWKQGKPIFFQDMYALAMTINHHYWQYHYARQVEKVALESYSQKQGKASSASHSMTFQNEANSSPVVLSTKTSPFKPYLFSTSKKQPNSLQVNLSSKLSSNSKLTSNFKNNMYLYCSTKDYKLDFCSKKQTIVTPKNCSASVTVSKKLSEKQRVTSKTLYRLRATLNFPMQQ